MNVDRNRLSQSLPDHGVLDQVDTDDDIENSRKDFLRYGIREKRKDIDYTEYRASYKKAMENFDLTPTESPLTKVNGKSDYLNQERDQDNISDELRSYPKIGESIIGGSHWTLNHSDRELNEEIFPLSMKRCPSVQSLRNRRNPVFSGNRAIRSKRIIEKSGERNVLGINMPARSIRYIKDFVTTLIDLQWRYTLMIFSLSFASCWLLFAIMWYLIAYAHGDLNFHPETGERLSEGSQPCVTGCEGFAGYLLLSIETQVSIGFGNKFPSEECPEAVFLMITQLLIGMLLEGAMVGIVYVKMIRPIRRNIDQKFSRKAVICLRDGQMCLIFRIDDPRESHLVETKVQAIWLEEKRSPEGERLGQFQYPINLENNGKIVLLWPQTIAHIIDKNSPLYDLSAKDLLEKRFEIILTINGISGSTGQLGQARTSYLSKEVMWGYRFKNMFSYNYTKMKYVLDYSVFDETETIDTPLCSAKRLEQVYNEVRDELLHFENDFNDMPGGDEHQLSPIGDIILEYSPKAMESSDNTLNEKTEFKSDAGTGYAEFSHEDLQLK